MTRVTRCVLSVTNILVIVLVVVLVLVLETHKSKNAEDENEDEYEDEITCNVHPATRTVDVNYLRGLIRNNK